MIEVLTFKLEKLISTLLNSTENGAVGWLVTDDPHTFAFTGASGSVLITRGDDGWAILRVLDESGGVADSYRGADSKLNRLLWAAERDAVDIARESPVVDALLKELETAGTR